MKRPSLNVQKKLRPKLKKESAWKIPDPATLFVLLITAVIALFAFFDTRRANDFAREDALKKYIADQRPWISVHTTLLSAETRPNGLASAKVQYELKNHGKTPANRVFIITKQLLFYDYYDKDGIVIMQTDDYKKDDNFCWDADKNKDAKEIKDLNFQSGASQEEANQVLFQDETLKATHTYATLKGDKNTILVKGCVFYRSAVDDELHQTRFNYMVIVPEPKTPTETPEKSAVTLDNLPIVDGFGAE